MDLSSYDRQLLPLSDQRDRLQEFDKKYWDGRFAQEIAQFDVASHHQQRVDDAEILYVEFGSPRKTIENWWKVLAGEHERTWLWDKLHLDPDHLRLGVGSACHYRPGVHRVRINLVSESRSGISQSKVRELADERNETLAQCEVMAAYALHPELAKLQDGLNFPKFGLPGFEVETPDGAEGEEWQGVLSLGYDADRRRTEMSARLLDNPYHFWSSPIIVAR